MHPVTVAVIIVMVYAYALALVAGWRTIDGRLADGGGLFFVLVVPALNEAAVIGRTLSSLLGLRGHFVVLVVDDASDDDTVATVRPFLADGRVLLLSQPRERARRGKGAALNAAFAEIRRLGLPERAGPDNLIVGVFDADAFVAPDFLQIVAAPFADPAVAGVQSSVRMYNARQNLLTRWQDFEFAMWGNIFSRAKNRLGTATLGGNGQCVRHSALAALGAQPWTPASLTEDLDLSLRLLLRGWRMHFAQSAVVWQEAVPHFRRLVRQRSRWMQGHFVCWEHLPGLLRAPLPLRTRLDLAIYLLLPAVFVPIAFETLVSWIHSILRHGQWTPVGLLVWYLLACGMAPLTAASLRRVDRTAPWRAVVHGHLFIAYSVVWAFAAFAAMKNVLLGRRAWAKTSRSSLPAPPFIGSGRHFAGD
jgi:cellulose synthase/poly-beta-1,6-N-acetylglucosamine synthase-like glycosyltransferase